MAAPLPRTFPDPPPARWTDLLGRLALGAAGVALLYGLANLVVVSAAQPSATSALATLRVVLFALTVALSALVQGARPRGEALAAGVLLAGSAGLLLHVAGPYPSGMGWTLARLESSLLAAVCLGTWLARGVKTPAVLLTVVLCAAAGDAWFTVRHVPESAPPGHVVGWLRLAWPPGVGSVPLAPAFTDLAFCAVYMEVARGLGFRRSAVGAGALAGYSVASLLALLFGETMPALPLVGLGVLTGAWPSVRCTPLEVLKALLAALVLFGVLLGASLLRRALYPQPKTRPDIVYPRNLAEGGPGPVVRGQRPPTRRIGSHHEDHGPRTTGGEQDRASGAPKEEGTGSCPGPSFAPSSRRLAVPTAASPSCRPRGGWGL
jgi:hypothetical protein